MKKILSAVLAVLLVSASLVFTGCEQKTTLYLYNCNNYMDETILKEFEDEFNCVVKVSYFESPEEMYTKITTTGASYDVLISSDYMIARMIEQNMLKKLDYSNIAEFNNIDAKYKNHSYDPNNEYSVPYMWGTLGILYNKDKVEGAVNSWDVLWDAKYKNDIYMIDSARDAFAIALMKLGYSINETDSTKVTAARDLLVEQRNTVVKGYSVDQIRADMAQGRGALGVVYSGDAITAIQENETLAYALPDNGTNVWFDAAVVPANAANAEYGEKFIDFLCRGDIAKRNVDEIGYCTPNIKAYEQLDDAVKNNTLIYPSTEYLAKCEVFEDWGDASEEYETMFLQVKNS